MATRRGLDIDPLAERDRDLEGHEVEPRHHLGDGVLHLQACVHLEEVELAVLVDDALNRARVHVVGALGQGDRRVADPLAQVVVDYGGWGLLDQLLVPSLHRAVALAEERHVAVGIGEDLSLDVVRPLDVALEEDLGAAEVRLGLAGGATQGVFELLG